MSLDIKKMTSYPLAIISAQIANRNRRDDIPFDLLKYYSNLSMLSMAIQNIKPAIFDSAYDNALKSTFPDKVFNEDDVFFFYIDEKIIKDKNKEVSLFYENFLLELSKEVKSISRFDDSTRIDYVIEENGSIETVENADLTQEFNDVLISSIRKEIFFD